MLDLWLLLGDAVDGAHAPDKWLAVNRHYLASGEESLQGVDCAVGISVAEDRSKHDAISDVEVCLAGRQAFEVARVGAAAADNARHR